MKKLITIIFAVLFFIPAFAQDKLPSFGKIDKADLEMKDCDFDPGVEALVLIDVGDIEFTYVSGRGWQSESNYRVRIKILKESGLHRAEIKLGYYSKDKIEYITGVNGISYNLGMNGEIEETKLEKSGIFDKSIDKDHSEISFALPNVKKGTVFEYKYRRDRTAFGGIPSWAFQQGIPVRYSAYNIMIPQYFEFTVQTIKRQEVERVEGRRAEDGTWYIMRNIQGLKDEPYSFGRESYLQRIEFQLAKIESPSYYKEFRNTWPKLIEELLDEEDFGGILKKNIKETGEIDAAVIGVNSKKEKIRLVYNYVQKNMLWDNEYTLYSGDNKIKQAWDKKNGSITDINFILIKLLRNAGVDAKPLLVSTKDNGAINMVYPFLLQFNAVMAYVKVGDETYIMNAADKYNPFDMIPYDVLYSNALIVDKTEGGLVALESDAKFNSTVFFTCSVEADGKLSGQANLTSSGYARNIRMNTYKKAKLKEQLEDNEGITIKVDSISLKNENDELLPLEQKVEFGGNMQTSGEYFFLPVTIFTGIAKNPFVAETRVMDIDFNFPKTYVVSGSYVLAENYVVNALPKNTKMILPDTSIVLTRTIQQSGNIISFRYTLDFGSPGYTAGSYPYIKDFFKKMYDILDERIVLKKK